jgi:hypothetical protein
MAAVAFVAAFVIKTPWLTHDRCLTAKSCCRREASTTLLMTAVLRSVLLSHVNVPAAQSCPPITLRQVLGEFPGLMWLAGPGGGGLG